MESGERRPAENRGLPPVIRDQRGAAFLQQVDGALGFGGEGPELLRKLSDPFHNQFPLSQAAALSDVESLARALTDNTSTPTIFPFTS